MNKASKTLFLIPIAGLFLTLPASAATKLKDVPKTHWAYESVQTVVDQGFMAGDPSGRFAGNRPLTRYEFAKAMSKMAEHYNAEIDQNKKDLEGTVSVMEVFQNELKTLEGKTTSLNDQLKSQDEIVDELNELVVALGDEYAKIGYGNASQSGINSEAKKNFEDRLAYMETEVNRLKNKGLVIDTLVKGTVNDFKKLGKATDKMVDSINKQRFRDRLRREQQEELETITAPIAPTPAPSQIPPQTKVQAKVDSKPTTTVKPVVSKPVTTTTTVQTTEVLEEVTE